MAGLYRGKWNYQKLADICEINMGQSPKSEFYNHEGRGLPFLQGNRTFGSQYLTFDTYTTMVAKIAEAGDVIMSVRAPVGDANTTPVKICLGRGVCSLRHTAGEQEFLYYLMRHYARYLISRQGGTVFGSVNRSDISNLVVFVPPIEEQAEIGRTFRALDDRIENNTKINHHLSSLRSATNNSPDIKRGKRLSRVVVKTSFSRPFAKIVSMKVSTASAN